ncbi:MAG: 3D domain-containing protein [Ichthyobacteriaceae bacterium]|nr:3D domain-containing protein [Ichthyobacteriaceae bacterium]
MVVLKVEATAYNSLVSQTDSNPTIAAWGDKLKPGMKCIAVSRDLLEMGLTHNTEVTIEGLDGVYLVKDKMAARWTKRIDIYMGVDSHKAFKWGVRNVKIKWKVKK